MKNITASSLIAILSLAAMVLSQANVDDDLPNCGYVVFVCAKMFSSYDAFHECVRDERGCTWRD